MNENIELIKERIGKKKSAQDKLVGKMDGIEAYIAVQQTTLERYRGGVEMNKKDLVEMGEIFARVEPMVPRYDELQKKLQVLVEADGWVFGDPEEEKLENNPEYSVALEEFMEIGRKFGDAKTEVNKIYFRR